MANVPSLQAVEHRPENRRRSMSSAPFAVPAGPLRPERSESFYEDLDLPPPEVVADPGSEPPASGR